MISEWIVNIPGILDTVLRMPRRLLLIRRLTACELAIELANVYSSIPQITTKTGHKRSHDIK